jgi:hypothetical protein
MTKRSNNSAVSGLIAAGALAVAGMAGSLQTAYAEDLATPASVAPSSVDHPTRGMTMDKVEAKFGAPTKRDAAVGEPPITRWEYPGFVVFFEHQYVLHTVIAG